VNTTHTVSTRQAHYHLFRKDFAFSDPSVDVPGAFSSPSLSVLVDNSSFNGWALYFTANLDRASGYLKCFLTYRKGFDREKRIFETIKASLDEYKGNLGDSLDYWEDVSTGRPRIGYFRPISLDFLSIGEKNQEYDDAVRWMKAHLDNLVSILNPQIQRMLGHSN
ncbi:MAG: hypothetical protein OXU48_09460, partial [candidate division Zixibacteria bacterium]|nr:hypothetical protein [candidate division Zixibacteria bacterium]